MIEEQPTPPSSRPNGFLFALREHRIYGAAVGYLVAAWIILQVAAIVLPGFGAPAWILRALMILLALGLGATLLAVWGKDRRMRGLPLLPRTSHTRLVWALTAILPTALVTAFFLLHPLGRPAPAPLASAPAAAPMDKSIAVLPFDHFSKDDDSAMFADGVQDEVLTDLSKLADLKVISRSSVLQYKNRDARNLPEIGKALGVAYIVEGSVQRTGNRIRVTAQLIDAHTDAHQWAEKYDRELNNVFDIQSEIAQAIAGQLQAAISPQEHAAMLQRPTANVEAYAQYVRGKQIVERSLDLEDQRAELLRAVDLLDDATRRDPGFVDAYCFAARAHDLL